jgi:DNA-binding HxlR family transcriptional regulator
MSTDDTTPPQEWKVTTRDREECPVTAVLRRVGDKWSPVIIRLLSERGYGFNELDRAVEGLSRRVLTRTLRALEDDGLVSRTTGRGTARVEYSLTELGRSLREQLAVLGHWAVSREAAWSDRPMAPMSPARTGRASTPMLP